jgi:lysophospholipid acyltransferase (LPLAT)-like uncharacterized protein
VTAVRRRLVEGPLTRWALANGHRLVLLIGRTWRVRYVGREVVDRARFAAGGPVVYALTHGVLLPLVFTHRGRDVQALISESRDGEIITRITSALGFGAVRGSSSKGGAEAVVRLAKLARAGYDLAITPDGPRGPRGSVGPGTIRVAARGKAPIIPVAAAADRAWRARSWDRFLVPKPFARVWVVYGEPIRADGARSEDEVAALAARVAEGMARVEAEAEEYASGCRTAPSVHRVPA